VERKLAGDRRHWGGTDAEKLDDISLLKVIFHKRLPQILGAYIAGGWIAVEAAIALNGWKPTDWLIPLVVTSLPFGFFAVSIVGWFHGEKGRQRMPSVEKWLLWTLGVGWVGACLTVLAI